MKTSREVVSFILTSFYEIVSPFTGLLCSWSGRSPDLRSRSALMDHSDDASLLFAVGADSSDDEIVDVEVEMDLGVCAELFDEWMLALTRDVPVRSALGRLASRVSERPGAHQR